MFTFPRFDQARLVFYKFGISNHYKYDFKFEVYDNVLSSCSVYYWFETYYFEGRQIVYILKLFYSS